MGLFSSTKIISVASTVYNLAGDEDARPNFLKGNVFSNIILDSDSFTDGFFQNYMNGPGLDQQKFFNYSKRNNVSTLPSLRITDDVIANESAIASEINVDAGLTVEIKETGINTNDITPFVSKWILENHPSRYLEDWLADYNSTTEVFSVEFPNNDFYSWLNMAEFNPEKTYLTALYATKDGNNANVGDDQFFIYELNSGNATLDALVVSALSSDFEEFFPSIPVRIDNKSIRHSSYTTLYQEMTKVYKKAFNNNSFDDFIDSVEDNPDLDDIDYAYVVFGVSLNVDEPVCRNYIYRFIEKAAIYNAVNKSSTAQNVLDDIEAYEIASQAIKDWDATDWSDTPLESIPVRPSTPSLIIPGNNTFQIKNSNLDFDMRLNWEKCTIDQLTGNVGLGINEYKVVNGPTETYSVTETIYAGDEDRIQTTVFTDLNVYIYWQETDSIYRRITLKNFVHQNYIYKGKAVVITAKDALADSENSGFIIPLHYPTFKELGIVSYTQISTADVFLILNSYEVTKQKWYESSFFRILIVIAVIVTAVVFSPGLFAGGTGLLGSNLSVGLALGFTGISALIAGVVSNYIASLFISQLFTIVASDLFGDEFGTLFATITMIALSVGITQGSLFSTENLLKITQSSGNVLNSVVQKDINKLGHEFEVEQTQYEEQMDKIQELLKDLDSNSLNFNPIMLTESNFNVQNSTYVKESLDEYIQRTTMNGSEVVDLTFSMVYDFVQIYQTLPRN